MHKSLGNAHSSQNLARKQAEEIINLLGNGEQEHTKCDFLDDIVDWLSKDD